MKFIDLPKEYRVDILDSISSKLNIHQREAIEKDTVGQRQPCHVRFTLRRPFVTYRSKLSIPNVRKQKPPCYLQTRCMGIFSYTNICVVLILELVTVVNQLGFAEHQVVEHSLVSTLANHL